LQRKALAAAIVLHFSYAASRVHVGVRLPLRSAMNQ
jgi:hypothetical protein